MIFTKYDTSTSDEEVDILTSIFNVHYRACIGLLVYLLSTVLGFIFTVHKLAFFLENPGKVNF